MMHLHNSRSTFYLYKNLLRSISGVRGVRNGQEVIQRVERRAQGIKSWVITRMLYMK